MKTTRTILNALAMASLTLAGIASADEITKEGYMTDSSGNVVKSGYGQCWHTGYWTPAMAIEECDPDQARKNKSKVAETRAPAAAPAPAPAPVPVAAPAPAPAPAETRAPVAEPAPVVAREKAVYVSLTLQADTLFDFDKSVIHADGKKELNDKIVNKLKEYSQTGMIMVAGYTDRIGTAAYNQKLSQRRADAVKDYLVSQGIASNRIETVAKGESDPLVSCDHVKGRVSGKNKALVKCLQPNRRQVVEIQVQKRVQN